MLGMRFERLTVIAPAEPTYRSDGKSRRRWKCRCDCGNETVVLQTCLRSGDTRSCGCLYRELLVSDRLTHGQSKTRLYTVWTHMKQRCFNPNDDRYADYGGRGITVCDAWRESFEIFLQDMGPRPLGHTLDRIDNDGNYEPANCRWATAAEQARNKRNNIIVEWRGARMTLKDAAQLKGIHPATVWCRLERGWSLERALTTPPRS